MGIITVTWPTDGTTADAADISTPGNTIVNEINGNLDNTNIKASAGIDFSKIAGGNSTGLLAWQTWTPTWTNLTVGNGTATGKYIQIGKNVLARYSLTLGSTSSVGSSPNFPLPVTAASYFTTGNGTPIGQIYLYDQSDPNGRTVGPIFITSTTVAQPAVQVQDVTFLRLSGLTSAIPFTWTSTDALSFQIVYEAA